MNGAQRDPRWIVLLCSVGHEHLVSPEQLLCLEGTPCCWCRRPIYPDLAQQRAQRRAEARVMAQALADFWATAA